MYTVLYSPAFYRNGPHYSVILGNIVDMMRGDVNSLAVRTIKALAPPLGRQQSSFLDLGGRGDQYLSFIEILRVLRIGLITFSVFFNRKKSLVRLKFPVLRHSSNNNWPCSKIVSWPWSVVE